MVVGFSERYAENKQGTIAGESYGKDGVSPKLPPNRQLAKFLQLGYPPTLFFLATVEWNTNGR